MNQLRRIPMRNLRHFCVHVKETTNTKKSSFKQLVPATRNRSKIDLEKLPPKTKIDADTIALLERLSLVDCENKLGVETLEAALEFADQILQVDTNNVEPLITVLEDRPLKVRNDEVTEGNCKDRVLSNAVLSEEDYFVAPPGNIPLETREDLLHEKEKKKL